MSNLHVPPKLEGFDRFSVVYEAESFFPTSYTELTQALSLIASEAEPGGGAAKYLGEIVLRQTRIRAEEPLATGRRITRDFINYVANAQQTGHNLTVIRDELEDVNPELILDRVIELNQLGLLELLRYVDLAKLHTEHDVYKVGYDPLRVAYKPDNPGIVFYASLARDSWRVKEARENVQAAILEQGQRMDFFTNAIAQVAIFYPALRPIAQSGLEKLYNISHSK